MLASALALACLPALLCWTLATHPAFFTERGVLAAPVRRLRGASAVWLLLGCLLAVPLALLAFSGGTQAALLMGAAASFAGAMWGALRLGGRFGAALALAAAAIALVGVGFSSVVATDALSVCAGLGAAHLLHTALPRRTLACFLVVFAVLDVFVVGSGLATNALHHLPLAGVFMLAHAHTPLFNRVQVGSAVLGSGDIAYGALVGAMVAAAEIRRSQILLVCLCYGAFSAALAFYATSSGFSVPETVPGALALAILLVCLRRTAPTPLSPPGQPAC